MRAWKYTAHAYANRGSTWTGWVKMDNGVVSSKFISRSGYESREAAMAYADRWAERLAIKCHFDRSAK